MTRFLQRRRQGEWQGCFLEAGSEDVPIEALGTTKDPLIIAAFGTADRGCSEGILL